MASTLLIISFANSLLITAVPKRPGHRPEVQHCMNIEQKKFLLSDKKGNIVKTGDRYISRGCILSFTFLPHEVLFILIF